MISLQGFGGHGGSILSTGAGWLQWKPLDTPGTHLGWVYLLEKNKLCLYNKIFFLTIVI